MKIILYKIIDSEYSECIKSLTHSKAFLIQVKHGFLLISKYKSVTNKSKLVWALCKITFVSVVTPASESRV